MRIDEIQKIQIELTSVCNCRCSFCQRVEDNINFKKYLSIDIIDKILMECYNLEKITLYGNTGEFAFHPQIFEIIKKIKKQNIKIYISTNGGMYNVDWWNTLGKLLTKDDIIDFCIDGLEDTHSRYRGTDYNKVVENMKILIKNNICVNWKYIVFGYNEHQIEEARRRSKEYGCNSFSFLYSRKYDDMFTKPSWYNDIKNISSQFIKNKKLEKKNMKCKMNKGEVYIGYDGIMVLCCYFMSMLIENDEIKHKYNKNKKYLDVLNNNINDILSNEVFLYFSSKYNEIEKCKRKCWILSNKSNWKK